MLVLLSNAAHAFIERVFDMDDHFKDGGVVAHRDGLNLVEWNFTVLTVIKKTFAKKN